MFNNNPLYEQHADKLYNPDLKFEFLEKNYPNNYDTQQTIVFNFIKSGVLEKLYDKDLCIFNSEEIKDLVESLGYTTENTIRVALSYFSAYVDWCIAENKRGIHETYSNDIDIFIATQDLSKFVSKIKTKHRYVTKEELYYAVDLLNNPIDQVLLLGLYEGIAGEKLYELRSLKRKNSVQFDAKMVILIDINGNERMKPISSKLTNILKEAIEQEDYLLANGENLKGKGDVRKLINSEYILRPTVRGDNDVNEMMTYSVISGKFTKVKKYIGLEHATPQSIVDSGMINRVIELTKEHGLDEPTLEIFQILQQPNEYNLSHMELYNFRKKYKLATKLKDFK